MRLVFGLVLVLGLGLAGAAVYMAKDQIGSYQNRLARANAAVAQIVPTKDVYVMKRAISYGEYLTKEDVVQIRWPENALPEGVFIEEAALFPEDEDAPRAVLRRMEVNEPVMAVKVTAPGEDAGLSSRLAAGMRAFAIRVDVSTGVSGFLRPGHSVDVYWTGRNLSNPSAGEFTRLIQASIPIMAIDQIADGDRNSPVVARTVTVEVSSEQVAALAQAQSTGRLSLALVGSGDTVKSADVEIDQNTLLGVVDKVAAAPAPQEKVCTIRERKGSETVVSTIPCTN